MDLAHEFTLQVSRGEALAIGAGPFGQRVVAAATSGRAKGARINGDIVGPGADWAVFGTDRYAQIDVRLQIRTDDGAVLLMTYTGSLELNKAASSALAGGETAFDDHYFRIHARIESGEERYAWVNRTLFVGEGRLVPDGVEFVMYRVT